MMRDEWKRASKQDSTGFINLYFKQRYTYTTQIMGTIERNSPLETTRHSPNSFKEKLLFIRAGRVWTGSSAIIVRIHTSASLLRSQLAQCFIFQLLWNFHDETLLLA